MAWAQVGILLSLVQPAGELEVDSQQEVAPGQVVPVFGDGRVLADELLPDVDGLLQQAGPRGS